MRVSATALASLNVESLEHWRALCPTLHVEGEHARPVFDVGDVNALIGDLRYEGYVNVPGVLDESVYGPLRDCVATLHEASIPIAFAFVYDEFWLAFQGASRFIEAALGKGYLALPDFWVWHVTPSEGATGFGPHRDKTKLTLDSDNSPHSLTVWLPFTDATPLNGCIYVLPANHDSCFTRRVWDGAGNNKVEALQDIRALPAPAGSFLAWNQAILHWGARASRRAKEPRTSAAFEFQRSDKPPFNEPLLDPLRIPTFEERLGLIGKQVLQYQHMYPLAPDVARLATEIRDRFMPRVAGALLPGASPGAHRQYEPSNNRRPDQSSVSMTDLDAFAAQPSATPSSAFDRSQIRDAMHRRLIRRSIGTGQITLPAVPHMIDSYVTMCDTIFQTLGSKFTAEELAHLKAGIENQLTEAYAASPRSTITIKYDKPVGTVLNYTITHAAKTIDDTYHDWIALREPPLFGTKPDARVWALANETADPERYPVLDIGAGTGRNALPLARRGHPVDVVELTPKFAEMIRSEAQQESLEVRVIQRNIFATRADLRLDYQLILLSEVVPEFRTTQELRNLFELAADSLAPGGRLVFNTFLAKPGYTPDKAALEWGEQAYTSIFTWPQTSGAVAGLPLELISDDSVYEYEKANLPEGAWPPTGWYESWITGRDVFDVTKREDSPIEMRWLVYEKTGWQPSR